jgi:integrase
MKLRKLSTIELQDFFDSYRGKLSPSTIKNMRACLSSHLNQAVAWGMLDRNPAERVRIPKQKLVKPPVVLAVWAIRKVIEILPEPTRSVVTLIVFGSMRIGEVLALQWRHIRKSYIHVEQRVYDGVVDEVKTESGNRLVPFDGLGLMDRAIKEAWKRSNFHDPEHFVFCTRDGKPIERRNLLRHVKAAAVTLGYPKTIDFRSFRTMHASLMGRQGTRLEVIRDNMGHAETPTTSNIYNRTWWDERATAVTKVAEAVMTAEENSDKTSAPSPTVLDENEWEPLWVPQLD